MTNLTGEYECKLDERGRLKLPQKLLESLGTQKNYGFIVNRGFEKNLAIYPRTVWEEKTKEINQLNIYDKQQRDALRYFYRGATELFVDSADRLNIPGSLLEYGGIEKDVILFAYINFMELWSKTEYEKYISAEPENFSELIQDVMAKRSTDQGNRPPSH